MNRATFAKAAIATDGLGWLLMLVGSERVGDERRLRLVGDDLQQFVPGEDRALSIWVMRGAPLRRFCHVDNFDPSELRLDLTLPVAGDDQFEGWAASAEVGDPIVVEPHAAKTRIYTEDRS